jgi:ferrous iron transport protein B
MIALVIPSTMIIGFINIQGIVLMALYLVGFGAALTAAFLMKYLVKTRERGYYIMEMPEYRSPKWTNLGYTIFEKVKIFLFEAGKIIVAISIVLWFLSSFGPTERMEKINKKYEVMEASAVVPNDLTRMKDAEKLENSYAGILGKTIEPAIAPLGFDWKIGIALITSFAAREVFVGTMSTIYSVQGDDEDIKTIKQKMHAEINPATGGKLYTVAVGFSLMLFYAFAMQCMSTIAVVKRETASWKWPLIQVAYMSGLAYLASLLAYNLLK